MQLKIAVARTMELSKTPKIVKKKNSNDEKESMMLLNALKTVCNDINDREIT